MDVFAVRKRRLAELAKVEKTLLQIEGSCGGVPASLWQEHARLAVRRYQLSLGIPLGLVPTPGQPEGKGEVP